MQTLNVPLDLKLKVSAYVEYYWSTKSRDNELEQELITKLDPRLQENLIFNSYGSVLLKVPWLKHKFSEEFLRNLSNYIREMKFSPDDICFKQVSKFAAFEEPDDDFAIYFIFSGQIQLYYDFPKYNEGKGIVLKTLSDKQVFGEYSFITD